MSHSSKPLFYFGIAILSLLLVTTSIATNNKYFYDPKIFDLPYFIWNYQTYKPHTVAVPVVYAQDDDEKGDEEDEDKDEEEKGDESEESKEEDVSEEEALEEVSDQLLAITEEKNEIINQSQEITTEEQSIKQELNDLLVEGDFVNPYAVEEPEPVQEQQPVVNTSEQISTVQPEPVVTTIQDDTTTSSNKPHLNLSCNCTTNDTETFNPKPSNPIIQPLEPTQEQPQEQIIIPTNGIKSWKTTGELTDPTYTDFYHVGNIFDNTINDYSFWSQYGKGSSFLVHLSHPIQDYQVCSVEINSANPKGVPFVLDIGSSKNYTGVIDETIEKITLDKCIKNVNKIYMSFDSDQKYTSISELKLFGSKLINDQPTEEPQQKPDPDLPKPQPAPYKNVTKINISNSEAEINIQNSTVTFKFDPQSAKATNYNVITLPNTEVVN